MHEEHTYRVEDFIRELSAFSFSDVLVHLDPGGKGVFCLEPGPQTHFILPYSGRFNQIYKIAVQYKKTSDIQSLCAARHLIRWKVKERPVSTPLLLMPVHCTWNKIKQEFHIGMQEEAAFLNPFVVHYLQKDFGLELPAFDGGMQTVLDFLQQAGFVFSCEDFCALGNFHYHRFELIKDLEELASTQEPNALVKSILGEAMEEKPVFLDLTPESCFESDRDQEAVFEHFREKNLVLQGPPGTGKTQVLLNLLAKLLLRDARQLVVSEKKTALEVLEKKLKTRRLDHFVYLAHAQSTASGFVLKLKNTWAFLEKYEGKEPVNLGLSRQYLQQIQLTFDKLQQNNAWGECTLEEMQVFAGSQSYKELPYVSGLPVPEEWKKLFYPVVKQVYSRIGNPALLGKIRTAFLKTDRRPDQILQKIKAKFSTLSAQLDFSDIRELRALNRKAIVLQVLYNEQAQKYARLLDSERELKKYEKLKKQYRLLEQKLRAEERETQAWKKIPSLSEVKSWQQFLQQNWLVKRKTRKHILQQANPGPVDVSILLQHTALYLGTQDQLNLVKRNLFELGIEKPEFELNVIDYVLSEKNKISNEDWEAVRSLQKERQLDLLELAPQVKELLGDLETYFYLEEQEKPKELLGEITSVLDELCALLPYFEKLPPVVYRSLHLCANAGEFEQLVLKSNWVSFAATYPDLALFDDRKLQHLLSEADRQEELEQEIFSTRLIFKRNKRFREYHDLLQIPSAKLKGSQKELKAQLKAGKAILVKEFAKSRQHKSMRELMASDARLWIDLLCPVLLSTPTYLSRNVPLEKGFFECVIFDEASQLALPKAISSLQRAQRMLIAGDSQQMSPGNFFSGMHSGVDLLHQGSYYLEQGSLRHHYRSVHPGLIRFSNRHFYQNELLVYPAADLAEKALEWHYVENGIFDERRNVQEANVVARCIEEELKSGKTLGIVAFSEHQLSCIWNAIAPSAKSRLEEHIRENRVFFKALEQVQGEECERLIISLGYGKNKEGQFHHRFGPLNQKNGTKRLNVLFTRAIEHIHFFSSVRASDFQLSANEAINLLRLYLAELETQNPEEEPVLPFGMDFSRVGKKLTIPKIYRQLPDAGELKTFHEVMTKRGWEIKYSL